MRFRKPVRLATPRVTAKHLLGVEQLEERRLLAIVSAYDPSTHLLTVSTPDNASIAITSLNGYVQINGANATGNPLAANVYRIEVTAGADTASVDLSGVTLAASFVSMQSTKITFAPPPVPSAPIPETAIAVEATSGPLDEPSTTYTVDVSTPPLPTQVVSETSGQSSPTPDPIGGTSQSGVDQVVNRPKATSGVRRYEPDELAELSDRAIKIATRVVGPDWTSKLKVSSAADLIDVIEGRPLGMNSSLWEALDLQLVDQLGKTAIGADWQERLGIIDLPAYLESGDWQRVTVHALGSSEGGFWLAKWAVTAWVTKS